MNITSCPQCGGRVRSVSIGWKCESCQGFIDMRGEFHQNKEEPFMPTITNMDMGMLIERLQNAAGGPDGIKMCQEAATALSTLQAENEKLKDQLYDGEGVNLVNYWMQQAKIEENGHRNCQAENEKLRAELERVKRERDAAIEYLREIEWCAGCKHFGGLDGCKKWAMGQCTEKHDLYEFISPQKED